MKKISTSYQRLSDFIDDNAVLVDKSQKILELFNESSGPYFLSRPRRFGKSLLLDTIKQIALGNKELFSALAIGQKKFNYDWKSYPVIKIDMSGLGVESELFKDELVDTLNQISKANHLKLRKFKSPSNIYRLIEELSLQNTQKFKTQNKKSPPHGSKNVVLLIDEYDYPIIKNIGRTKEEIATITDTLHSFYTSVKSATDFLRFTFITGVTKFSQISMFSAMNTLNDITLNPKYASLCGFTDEEINLFFSEHVKATLNFFKSEGVSSPDTTIDEFMMEIKDYYDGYSWDSKTYVFNPFSLSNFLDLHSFGDYWYDSGQSLLVSRLNLHNDLYFRSFADSCIVEKALPVSDVGKLDGPSIMLQTGYLTVKQINITNDKKREYILKTPNKEIAYALIREYIKQELSSPDNPDDIDPKYSEFYNAFIACNQKICETLFSSFLLEIPPTIFHRIEFVPQILLYTYLNIKKYCSKMEMYVGEGRADIIFTPDTNSKYIIEIKYVKKDKDAESKYYSDRSQEPLDKAHTQMLTKKYAWPFIGRFKKIYMVAVSVHGQSDVKMTFSKFSLLQYKE
jgi:hypothetical protein